MVADSYVHMEKKKIWVFLVKMINSDSCLLQKQTNSESILVQLNEMKENNTNAKARNAFANRLRSSFVIVAD